MNQVEQIKMQNIDKTVKTKRQTSQTNNNSNLTSCFNLKKRQININLNEIEETQLLNENEIKSTTTPKHQILRTVKTETNLNEEDLKKLESKYINGLIKIQDTNGIVSNLDGSRYVKFKIDESNSKINEQLKWIPRFMTSIWQMKSPQIIISIITGVTNFKNWKNQKLEEQFRRGLIKAANKTEMWFITNGINGGISAMVGEAFNEERLSRSTKSEDKSGIDINYLNANELNQRELTLIGIVDAKTLQNSAQFDGSANILTASGNKMTGKVYRFDVNSDHTNFLIYDEDSSKLTETDDSSIQLSYDQFRNRVESLFTRCLSSYKRRKESELSDDETEYIASKSKQEERQVPMVCLTIRGDLNSIDAIEYKIKREIPVLILKGSGAASDIIAFAHEELTENKDPDYEDNFIKPEISKKLLDQFKDELNKNDVSRNQYRDKILSICKNGTKGTQKFLTIVDMKGLTFDFTDLDKYILTALLQSQTQLSGKQGKAQMDQNLRLTLDWNCPALALSEIFQRDDYTLIEIKHNIFENSIIRTEREEFVELFLDQGFLIHRYLGRNNIRDLFTKSDKKEFFFTVILQGILGHFTNELPDDFLPDGLNLVLKELTSMDNLINILEIYMNQLRFYTTDGNQAEKKALNFLILFAVLFNRHKLAKILWKRSEDPLPLALVCSLIYKNMLSYCQENYLKSQIEKYQNDFANAAIGVLEASFQDNDPRSYSVLSEKYSDWNNLTVLELAYNAKNRDFIAHPCVQKILTKRLFGSIQVRDVDNGFFEVPAWIKVTLSAFLILPMYYWIIFPITEKVKSKKNKKSDQLQASETVEEFLNDDDDYYYDKDEEQQEAEETKAELNKKLINEMKKNRKQSQSRLGNISLRRQTNNISSSVNRQISNQSADLIIKPSREYVTPPFYKKIYLVWHAPYTKFWINFLAYIFYLTLFGLVTLWPCCGNLILDSALWLWTACIAIEDTRIAYKNYLTGSQLPIKSTIIEIAIMILFLILFFFVRIIGSWDGLILLGVDRIFASKFVLCIFLLYFYYRTLFIFLPISHQLGPMLLRMKLMLQKDFMTYLRLFIIFMTASGIALNSIIYPFHPINYELFKKVFLFKGFLQIFTVEKADLEKTTDECRLTGLHHRIENSTYSCVSLTDGLDFSYSEKKLKDYGVSYKCNYMSLSAWIILIQYFLLVKLFLPSLLTAMFSATGSRVSAQSEQLWMFQRYEIVLDYEKRLILPPPFTLFSYAYMSLKWLFFKLMKLIKKCRICCKCFCFKHVASDEKQQQQQQQNKEVKNTTDLISKISSNNNINKDDDPATRKTAMFCYWRNIAQKYSADAEKDNKEKAKQKQMETSMNKVREDLSSQKKSMQRLNDRVISLEKSLVLNQSYLEQIKNLLTQKVSKSGLLDRKKNNYIHILSRESPYASTNIPRFFVYEKLVPWDQNYDLYDPPLIILSFEMFKVDRIFVDDDPNQKNNQETQITTSVQLPGPPPPPTLLNQTIMSIRQSQTINNDNQQQAPASPQMKHESNNNLTRRSSMQSLIVKPIFLWNALTYIDNPMQPGKKITIDRKSWISRIDEQTSQSFPLIYSLDSAGYPKNPMGRTGVRGRGALMRYGPNKEIIAIVTRWKKSKNRPIFVERRKLLEFVCVKDPQTGLSKVPGEKILGDESQYSVVCRTFMELVFEEQDCERGTNFTVDDMTSFFCSFSSETHVKLDTNTNKKNQLNDVFSDLGFVPTQVYCGYIDDPRNTDNAWIEAEIWNFHYDKDDYIDKRIKNEAASKWREVSSNVRINSNEIISDVLKEVAELHNAFYN